MAQRTPKAPVDTVLVLRHNPTNAERSYCKGTFSACAAMAARISAKCLARDMAIQLRPLAAWQAQQAAQEQARWEALPETQKRTEARAFMLAFTHDMLQMAREYGLHLPPNLVAAGQAMLAEGSR